MSGLMIAACSGAPEESAPSQTPRSRLEAGPGTLLVVAGSVDGMGSADGVGQAARFRTPYGVAVDASGNAFLSDQRNNTIRRLAPGGAVTTYAGNLASGSADGSCASARFSSPSGLAIDGAGNLFIADTSNSVIRKVSPGCEVSTLAGSPGQVGSADGTGSAARFRYPSGVAVDASGNVYVADSSNNVIRRISPAGEVTTVAGLAGWSGSVDGTGSAARFSGPSGVAVDPSGNIWVADTGNSTIRRITPAGLVTTVAGAAQTPGTADGTGALARFYWPCSISVSRTGQVVVADYGNSTIRQVTAQGVVTTLAGSAGAMGTADGTGSAARFANPTGVGFDQAGNVDVVDSGNNTIRRVTVGGVVTTLAGTAGQTGSADGPGTSARFSFPDGIALDRWGYLLVADSANNTIREISPTGAVATFVGMPGVSGSADGTGLAARFSGPAGVAVDAAGTVYVVDQGNATIRKVPLNGMVTTLAGSPGLTGSADGIGSAARFNLPLGIAVDGSGYLYVGDQANHTIRKVSPSGLVTTLAGWAGSYGSADGVGSSARFSGPCGVAVDGAGNVYVADSWNHTIRKITPSGLVMTLAGSAGSPGSADGTGSAARFNYPVWVAVDAAGVVYVSDQGNSTIRKVMPNGVVTTVVGTPGVYGNVPGPLPASLYYPKGIAVNSATGGLYIAVEDAILLARNP